MIRLQEVLSENNQTEISARKWVDDLLAKGKTPAEVYDIMRYNTTKSNTFRQSNVWIDTVWSYLRQLKHGKKEGAWSLMSEPAREKKKIKIKKESNMKIGHIVEACEKEMEEDQIVKDLGKGKGTPKKPDLKKGLKRESQFDLDQADIDTDAEGPLRRKDFPVRNRMDASRLAAALEACENPESKEECDDEKEKDEDMTPDIANKMRRPDLGNVGRKGWDPTKGKATEAFEAVLEGVEKKQLKKIHGRKYERPKTGYKHESHTRLLSLIA